MAAMTSSILKPEMRASGLALLNTTVSAGRFFSSFLFGLLWTAGSGQPPLGVFLAGMAAAIGISGWVLSSGKHSYR
jgi:hypothetical protein